MSDHNGKAQRRLSFVEDESLGALSSDHKRSSYNAPPPTIAGGDRRQSQWNPTGGRRRNSIIGRRLSNSFDSRKSSSQDAGFNRVKLQNTYKTGPDEDEVFQAFKLVPKIYEILEKSLHGKKYDANKTTILSKELTQDISREARNCMIPLSPRYKLVTHVVIGEVKGLVLLHLFVLKHLIEIILIKNKGQDIRCGSRCLWDSNVDNMASASYKNSSIYAVGTVFAVYFE